MMCSTRLLGGTRVPQAQFPIVDHCRLVIAT